MKEPIKPTPALIISISALVISILALIIRIVKSI